MTVTSKAKVPAKSRTGQPLKTPVTSAKCVNYSGEWKNLKSVGEPRIVAGALMEHAATSAREMTGVEDMLRFGERPGSDAYQMDLV
jgi:hypothetical protein